jgi:hypothetical protein
VPAKATTVTAHQVRAVVHAAHALAERQRARCADGSTAAAHERLARLDWAVSAGSRALAETSVRPGTGSRW